MGKNKRVQRSMTHVGQAQQQTEQTTANKFASTQELAQPKQAKLQASAGRINPQLSCTVTPEDKQLLDDLTVFATVKHGKAVNVSSIIRALIRNGWKNKEALEFQ